MSVDYKTVELNKQMNYYKIKIAWLVITFVATRSFKELTTSSFKIAWLVITFVATRPFKELTMSSFKIAWLVITFVATRSFKELQPGLLNVISDNLCCNKVF